MKILKTLQQKDIFNLHRGKMKTDSITIVGGGSAGWMTATTLIKAFPNKKISVVESKDVPIIGVGESTIGGIRRWTHYIGLDEKSFFPTTDASYKLSIKFTDFYKKNSGSFQYPFGIAVQDHVDENPYTMWFYKKYFFPHISNTDFVDSLFPSSALFNNNKFSLNENGEFDNFNPERDVAYHFDAVKFGIWLRDYYCKPQGVQHIVGTVRDVKISSGGIEELILEDGTKIKSDLYVDCTGFKSLLLGDYLKEPFIPYSDMLVNNSAWATRMPYKDKSKELEGYTNSTAIDNGWCWNIPLWSRLGSGYVYSNDFVSDEDALKQFKKYLQSNKMTIPRSEKDVEELEYKNIKMRVGIHERTFVKNVVAIGLSAGFIEPLESNGLFSVHEFLFKLVDILQRGDISQFDRDMYNVSVRDTFHGFAKFVVLHYALSHRDDTDYWKHIANKSFQDRYGDPYSGLIQRCDDFYSLSHKYFSAWEHPFDMSGITFIATGMNLNMMNENRIKHIEFTLNQNILNQIQEKISSWEKRKIRWKNAADKSPTLEQFLLENFYS
jgi:tryptophan halogenase